MKNPIVHNDFLLLSKESKVLYHDYASKMPIIDYHCHLPIKEIAQNKVYKNLSEIWLEGDHYKWRAMRANGINEKFITGEASDWMKFKKWAETVPYTMRNPLFHWTHMELKKPFGIHEILNNNSAKSIYDLASEQLSSGELSVHKIIERFNVEKICTTEDPLDSLEYHRQLKNNKIGVTISTSWRPDRAIDVRDSQEFNAYVNALEKLTEKTIDTYTHYLEALKKRHNKFHENGCRLADHGLEFPFPIESYSENNIKDIFSKIRQGKEISGLEQQKFMAALLYELVVWNAEKGWVQQFHIGALRDVNAKGVRNIGKAGGFDSIADFSYVASLGTFLNRLEENGKLTKTIIYNLNPSHNTAIATMVGNFQDGSVPGKMQFGSAWWFLDQKDGMEQQINVLSNQGLLSRFVGMLTDSRSFLSYSRHEYFRRILCNIIGTDIKNGELPNDMGLLGKMVQDISYNNANSYFDI